tara:strand:+ start:464 stop:1108 length:645 start_codon:yes stop_codon:yes gene_type:complete
MFQRTKNFLKTTLLGGVIVILPITILIFAFRWLFGVVSSGIEPLTDLVVRTIPLLSNRYDELIATLIVIFVILGGCFVVGLFIRTRLGQMLYSSLESGLLIRAPGYKMVKETVNQFFGRKQSPFSSVALVQIFQNETMVTAFVTDRHGNGTVSVFVPTGPNPTSGFIYHIPEKYVHPVDVPVEDAMRSVISCGAGSEMLVNKLAAESISNDTRI